MNAQKILIILLSFFIFNTSYSRNYQQTTKQDGKIVVTDPHTLLEWTYDFVTDKNWQQALKYCEELNYGESTDWRLPTIIELASLINIGKKLPASDFPNCSTNGFWSSTTNYSGFNGSSKFSAKFVHFSDGRLSSSIKVGESYLNSVRCVRN